MQKRIDLATAERTLAGFADAGVWNHLFLMSGYAKETEADHAASLAFLRRAGRTVHSVQVAAFGMELDSDITGLSSRYEFVSRPRREPSFRLTVDLAEYGLIPRPEVAQRRVAELRGVAYGECGDVLAGSRHLWDAHKIVFTARHGRPHLPPELAATTLRGLP
jgi:hypothetical protein